MEVLYLFFSVCILLLGLAIFANKFRRADRFHFELKPNCLLTRWPVVFITGSRSLFYFSRYWNLYPVYLAEHGYEVFTVHLPWSSPSQRRERFQFFLEKQQQKKYHFVVDSLTLLEFKDLLWNNPTTMSVTEIANPDFRSSMSNFKFQPVAMTGVGTPGPLLRFSFWLHQRWLKNPQGPHLDTLGALQASAVDNGRLLLARMQELAEEDYHQDATL